MTNTELDQIKHKLELNVRFMDIDALGHVNNARYLNYLEEARISYTQEVLGVFKKIEEFNILVARIEIDFKRPILFGEKLTIHTKIARIGNKSFTFESILAVELNGEIHIAAKALQTLVTIDKSSGKSIFIPAPIISAINDYEKNP